MTVTLLRSYQGYAAGNVVDLPPELEAALVAQGLATDGGTLTSGALGTNATPTMGQLQLRGVAVVPAGQGSVAITIPGLSAKSVAWACVQQAAADGTLLYVARCLCTANTLTIYGNANATAVTRVAYFVNV